MSVCLDFSLSGYSDQGPLGCLVFARYDPVRAIFSVNSSLAARLPTVAPKISNSSFFHAGGMVPKTGLLRL
jgi:hypothetical protein